MAVRNAINLATRAHSGATLVAEARSLADVLAAGPLPLPVALAYAKEIASGAADFHRRGCPFGALAPAWIMIGPNGPALPQPNGVSHVATVASDLRDFGLLLHQMLTGLDPRSCPPPTGTDDDLEISPSTVRAAALRLAARCRSANGEFDLRHVSTELRLLHIMINGLSPAEAIGTPAENRPLEQPAAPTGRAKPERSRVSEVGCPSCGSSDVFPAQRLTILEKVLSIADLKTYRCHRCCQRFINLFGLHLPRPENE